MKQVALPILHFRKTAKSEYSNWRNAIVREFYQNSFDAGATAIHFDFQSQHINNEPCISLTVTDDGKGMNLETCENKLLTLGGSDKNNNDIGGYGVAKQILYFAWSRWEIKSQDYKIEGVGCQYEIIENQPWINGVSSTIYIEETENFKPQRQIENYLTLCETNVPTFVNGVLFANKSVRGEMIRELDWGTLYKNKNDSSAYISVRVNGMFMFYRYASSELGCALTLELNGDTREMLSSNRDGLTEKYCSGFSQLVNELSVNPISGTKLKNEIILKKFIGQGLTFVGAKLKNITANYGTTQLPNNSTAVFPKSNQPITQNVSGQHFRQTVHEETLTDMPDIMVRSIGELPKSYIPKFWSLKTKSTLALWHIIIKQIFIDNSISKSFGIGITLDSNVMAEYLYHDGTDYLLVNPEKWRTSMPKLSGNKWLMVQELKQRAIHEIAHMITSSGHNENFILQAEELEANTWPNEHIYKNIAKLRKIKFTIGEEKIVTE
jgi:hypothetical protein